MCLCCRVVDRRSDRRARAGQDFRTQAVALGSAVASVAEGARGLGRIGREGFRRNHQIQGLSRAAARQGLRPLRHGARRHRRLDLHQSRLSARPLPDHRRRRIAVPDDERQRRHAGARRLVSQIRGEGDEGRQVLPRLRARSRRISFALEEDHGARRHQGHEDPSGARHDGNLRDTTWRHQRAGIGAGSARRPRKGRRRCGDIPLGVGRCCSASTR